MTCEKLEARLLEARRFCNAVGVIFPIKDIKLAADNMRAEVVSVVMQHPNVDDFYPLVEMLQRIWASLVQREYKGMERDRPRDSEWHFVNGMSALATSLIGARTRKSGGTAMATSSNRHGAKGGKSGAEPITMLKGCCASLWQERERAVQRLRVRCAHHWAQGQARPLGTNARVVSSTRQLRARSSSPRSWWQWLERSWGRNR